MGLLDEAIREHLDLKRRRGADPAEIERAEREALGPVRRDTGEDPGPLGVPDQYDDAAPADSYQTADDAPGSSVSELDYMGEPDEQEGQVDDDAGSPFDADLSADAELASPDAVVARPEAADSEAGDAPAPAQASTPDSELLGSAGQAGRRSDETAEFDVERSFDAEESPAPEDVLEETPEFLQDTPDHDRLWFEQRPPRDFDFDG